MKAIFFSVLLSVAAGLSVSAETVLLLRSSTKVSGPDVLLGDLVSERTQISPEWAARRIFSSPPAGEVSYYALTTIAHALHDYYDMQKVVLRGEPVVSVQRKDRRVEKEELEQPILDYLKVNPPWEGLDLQVKVLSIPDNTRIPEGDTEYRITQMDQKTARGYSLAHILICVDDIEIQEIPVGVEVQSLTDVWVVRKNLAPGHILEADDLRSEKRVVDATSPYVPSSRNMEGFEVTQSMPAGGLLRGNAVSKPVCVRRGDWVAINVLGQNLHITLRGKALANGRLGERILCVNEQSQRQVLVELVGVGHGVLVRM